MASNGHVSAAAPNELLAWPRDSAGFLRLAGAGAVVGFGLYALLKPTPQQHSKAGVSLSAPATSTTVSTMAKGPALDETTKSSLLISLEKDGDTHAFLHALSHYDAEAGRAFLNECGEHVLARLRTAADTSSHALETFGRNAARALHLNSAATPSLETEPLTALATGPLLVARLAYALSDVVFVYTAGAHDEAARQLLAWAAEGRHNVRGHTPTAKKLQVRAGAGTAVTGALLADAGTAPGTSQAVSVLVPSQALPSMAPALHAMAASGQGVVLHVPLLHVTRGLRPAYDETPLAMAKDTGFCLLAAAGAQDAHDLALVAHLLATHDGLPVLHAFDGLRGAATRQRLASAVDPAFADAGRGERALRALLAAADSTGAGGASTPPASSPTARVEAAVHRALAAVQDATGRPQAAFSYHGSIRASAVLVVLGPQAPALAAAADAINGATHFGHRVGVVAVRVLRPWSNRDFCRALPRGTKRICVVEAGAQAQGSLLLSEVAAAFYSGEWAASTQPTVSFARLVTDARGITPAMAREAFERLVTRGPADRAHAAALEAAAEDEEDAEAGAQPPTRGAAALVDVISHPNVPAPLETSPEVPPADRRVAVIYDRATASEAHTFTATLLAAATGSTGLGLHAAAHTSADTYAAGGAVARMEVAASAKAESAADVAAAVAAADGQGAQLVVVRDFGVLAAVRDAVTRQLLPGGTLLVLSAAPGGNAEERNAALFETLGAAALRALHEKRIALRSLDTAALTAANGAAGTAFGLSPALVAVLVPLLAALAPSGTKAALQAAQMALRVAGAPEPILKLAAAAAGTGAVGDAVPLPAVPAGDLGSLVSAGAEATASADFEHRVHLDEEHAHRPSAVQPRSIRRAELAWRFLYKDVYDSSRDVRPGHHEIYRVKLTKNERLTPPGYHRHIFHLEMDTRGTGLQYRIGDALGVFAKNDAAETFAFLDTYGLEPSDAINVEHPDIPGRRELLTVATLFQERLDIFGKPTQKFYEALAPFAADSYQRARLEWLGTEDKEGFRLRQLETFTFADVLEEFDSARPPLEVLASIVPPIKPRHYSIASSLKMCPDSVHLLVVLVDWETPKGRKRYGQCTRYLANLRPEDEPYLSVDIKPSVMRLPADPKQPVIMAGLGTGMAPFRAFLQERQWQKTQGVEVGPTVLYFGARHRSEEYLYGEYLDAMHADGLITTLGLAFSRDQKEKVYIQHKIEDDRADISRYLVEQKGHFYLCGPTWPVPDVKNAILGGVRAETSMGEDESEDWLEQLKEEGRYILEVY